MGKPPVNSASRTKRVNQTLVATDNNPTIINTETLNSTKADAINKRKGCCDFKCFKPTQSANTQKLDLLIIKLTLRNLGNEALASEG
ncbi:hypothetical protein ANRL2_01927 [Anaerolineae bacterium]|nr:hypothetical protein ANRL2_01927 [Anaerolineae bacterium]